MLSWPLTGLKSTLIKKLTKSAKRAKKLERVKFLKYLLHFEREKVSKNAKNGSFWRFLENLVVFLRFMLLSKPAFFSPIFTSMVWHTYGNVMLSVPSDSYWLFSYVLKVLILKRKQLVLLWPMCGESSFELIKGWWSSFSVWEWCTLSRTQLLAY